MPLTETFTDNVAVTSGNPTKASELNNVSNNSDALKERLNINHYFNNTGVANEDGYHKAVFSDSTYLYLRTGAGTGVWMALWIDNTDTAKYQLCVKFGTSLALATPASV